MRENERATTFAEAFDAAVRARGVSLSWLHRRLTELAAPVSVATLSYWRSGRSGPERKTSMATVDVLEEVLGLDRGALSRHLRPVRRPGPPGRAVPIEELTGEPEATRRALAGLGFRTSHDELVETAIVLSMDVDAEARAVRISVLARYRALVEGAQRVATVLTVDHPGEGPPRIVPRAGIDVGRSVHAADDLLVATELLLERPLVLGGDAMVEYEVVLDGQPRASTSLAYYAARRVGQAVVWARFHPDAIPISFEAFDVVDGEEIVEPLTMDGGRTLHRRASQYGPGTLGLRWTW